MAYALYWLAIWIISFVCRKHGIELPDYSGDAIYIVLAILTGAQVIAWSNEK